MIKKPQTTEEKDFAAGAKEAKAGYYDKWYRYNRKDDGKAYDAGHASVPMHKDGCKIIPCMS